MTKERVENHLSEARIGARFNARIDVLYSNTDYEALSEFRVHHPDVLLHASDVLMEFQAIHPQEEANEQSVINFLHDEARAARERFNSTGQETSREQFIRHVDNHYFGTRSSRHRHEDSAKTQVLRERSKMFTSALYLAITLQKPAVSPR